METDSRLPGPANARKFHNAACSGATTTDISKTQFADKPGSDSQYGDRPEFGRPQFATLTAGGDDVGFPGKMQSLISHLHGPRDELIIL